MPNIANLSLAQLRAATKAQIVTAIANYLTVNFTKRQIIGFLIDADVVDDPPARTFRTDGQIESETIDTRDAETGAVVASRQTAWTYYPTGEVDTITITEGATVRSIKHYLDGRQPSVTVHAALVGTRAAQSSGSDVPGEPEPDELQAIIPAVLVVLAFALFSILRSFPWLIR